MNAFVTGPPGKIFGKMARGNRRTWRPTSKPPHSQSGRFRELVRGLAGSLGVNKAYKASPTFTERERGVYTAV